MTANIPVRRGPFQYVVVGPDGSTTTVQIEEADLAAGSVRVEVGDGDRVLEIALASTSDPDLNPARGQLWP
jgi:hypothetical protein